MRPTDKRLDQFTDISTAMEFTGEVHRIPNTSPWTIKLREVPVKDDPTSLSMRIMDFLMTAITAADATSITLANGWPATGATVTIDSEQMYVSAGGTTTPTVTRGYNGTTATTHEWGTPVYIESSMEEVAAVPSAGQYYPDYYTGADGDSTYNSGEILCSEDDGGKLVSVDYFGQGGAVDARSVAVSLPDHIVEGLTISPPASGLVATVNTGKAWISNELVEMEEAISIYLQARRAQLAYIGLDGIPAVIAAAFPAAGAATVARWIVNGDSTIASTVGSNDLTASGAITAVNGWANDYAAKGDASSANYASTNSADFPTGAAERELDILVTFNGALSGNKSLVWYGTTAACFGLGISTATLHFLSGSSTALAYNVNRGRTYLISLCYDGTNLIVYVNGEKIYSEAYSAATAAGVMNIFKAMGAFAVAGHTVHYVELLSAMRSAAEIAAMSNALLLPVQYEVTPNVLTNGSFEQGLAGWTQTSLTAAAVSQGYDSGLCMQVTAGASGNNYKQAYNLLTSKTYTLQFKARVNALGGSTLTVGAYGASGFLTGASQTLSAVNTDYQTYTMTFAPSSAGTDIRVQANGTITAGDYLIDDIIVVEGSSISAETRDIRYVLPDDTHSLGRVRTDGTGVIEVRRQYRDGVREGLAGGNRIQMLGRQYFSGAADLTWDNPFGTRKVRAVYKYSKGATGQNEGDVGPYVYISSAYYGIRQGITSATPFSISLGEGGPAYLNGAWLNSGYLACYAEVMDDVV